MYWDANELYKKGYKKTKNKAIKAEVLFKQAECYRLTAKYKQASNFYKKSIKAKYNNSNPIAIYYYADMLMRLANDVGYEKALEQFKKYSKKVPNDNKVQRKILSCEYSINWIKTQPGMMFLKKRIYLIRHKLNLIQPLMIILLHGEIENIQRFILYPLERGL